MTVPRENTPAFKTWLGGLLRDEFNDASPPDFDRIKRWIGEGASLEETDEFESYTPLAACADTGYEKIARLLIDSGANVNAISAGQTTVLMLAAYEGHARIVKMLLDAGAKVDAHDSQYRTALMQAAARGKAQTVDVLLQYGADTTRTNIRGQTAIELAISFGHKNVIAVFEEHDRQKSEKKAAEVARQGIHVKPQTGENPLIQTKPRQKKP